MPIGFLITVTLPAVLTAAALAPVPHSWTLGQLTWRLGLQVNELPLVLAAWILLAVGLAAAQSDVTTPGGLTGLGIAAVTLVGLAVVMRRGLRARSAAERGLADGLGPGWRAGLPTALATRLTRHRPWAHLIFAPLAVRRHEVVHVRDVSYGPAGPANRLDIYRPRSGATTGPCLVYFHGGGYRSGRKNREARALIYHLARAGWVCASANYRLARTAPYPAALVDAKRAIAWMHDHAHDYGGDPSAIVVAGSSAGAHLAAMTALTPNTAALQPGFEAADTPVCAAVCLYGFYGSPGWIEREPDAPSAPITLLGPDAPPLFVAHGTNDSFVPVGATREFVARHRVAAPDRTLVYAELPGAQHTFDLYYSVRFQAVIEAVECFAAACVPAGGPSRHPG